MLKKKVKDVLVKLLRQVKYRKPTSRQIPDPILSKFSAVWHPILLSSLLFVRHLLALPTAKLWEENGELLFGVGELVLEIQTSEDLFILNELFYEGDYNLSLPGSFIVMDIGMNVGFTSLYYAVKPEVIKIYAYEPAEPTLLQGRKNIARNLPWSEKVIPQGYGLSDVDHTLQVDYTYQWKGSVGINELSEEKKQSADLTKLSIQLKDVAQEMQKIKALNPELPLVVKLDCEGSEYAIIERLVHTDLLKQVKLYMIEWHRKGPEPLEEIFKEHGFTCLSRTPSTNTIGMLYAFA